MAMHFHLNVKFVGKKKCHSTLHAGICGRGPTAPFILDLDISCQFHAPSGLKRKNFQIIHIQWEAGWESELVWTLWWRETSLWVSCSVL